MQYSNMQSRTSGGKAYPLFRPSVRNLALALGVASGTVLSAGAAYLLISAFAGLSMAQGQKLCARSIALRLHSGDSLFAVLLKGAGKILQFLFLPHIIGGMVGRHHQFN